MNEAMPRLIDLKTAIAHPVVRGVWRWMEEPMEKLLALDVVNDMYVRTLGKANAATYFATILDVLKIRYEVPAGDWDKLPTTGPLIVVANHPFGAAEGVVLGDLLTRVRPDVRLLGNHLLHEVPELRQWIIPVNPFGGEAAVRTNVRPLKQSLRFLGDGGALGAFPAGTVSHLHVRQGRVVDPPWHPSVAALARKSNATVVPVFFEGRNSALFQLAGLLHAGLRTALIPKELVKRTDSRITVRIGRPIGPDKLARYHDDETLTSYLRWKTYMLSRRESPVRPRFFPVPQTSPAATTAPVPIAAPIAPEVLAADIAQLPQEALLCEQGDFAVYVARAEQIPNLLGEIGREREVAFRDVGEGTGRARDLDTFDDAYLHLFMWNRTRNEIAGSYRLGRVDELLARGGVRSLYTSSLFKFRPGFLERLGPALELGRSFIRKEYQRRPLSLALLWRGIGQFLVRNPQYKLLFGPVSISRDYEEASRRIMIEALAQQRGDQRLGVFVKARNPPREKLSRDERVVVESLVKDVDDLSALITEIEADNKGMPVLLRHYLRLGARLLSFNVDPAFGHCIDGLIVVDLRTTDDKLLRRLMGDDGYTSFMAA